MREFVIASKPTLQEILGAKKEMTPKSNSYLTEKIKEIT